MFPSFTAPEISAAGSTDPADPHIICPHSDQMPWRVRPGLPPSLPCCDRYLRLLGPLRWYLLSPLRSNAFLAIQLAVQSEHMIVRRTGPDSNDCFSTARAVGITGTSSKSAQISPVLSAPDHHLNFISSYMTKIGFGSAFEHVQR